MATDRPTTPKAAPGKAGTQHTTAPGGLLADQGFAEDRDEVEGGTKGSHPQKPQAKPASAKPEPTKR